MKRKPDLETCCFEYDTSLGRLRIESRGDGVSSVDFVLPGTPLPMEGTAVGETPLISQAYLQLMGYLNGYRKAFSLPLSLSGTPFQRKVFDALLAIPYGETKTYGEIAKEIGCPGGARAVGGACHANPVAVVVPCHRVVGSKGRLTGYGGGLDKKQLLLDLERRNTNLFPFGETELAHLSQADEKMASLIARTPRPRYEVQPDLFAALVHSIVGQQISTKAQATVWTKLRETFDGTDPAVLASADDTLFRACGLSGRKSAYIKEAAAYALSGGFDGADSLTDDELRKKLTALRGVGEWTADMLLLFSLGRKDVFSYDDLGLRNGMCKLYGLASISREQFAEYGSKFSPFGSVASFYVWSANRE